MKRVKTTPALWRRQFAAHQASGLSVAQFCRQHKIRTSQWYYWRKRLDRQSVQPVSLVAVEISSQPASVRDCRIHLPNGIVLEFVGHCEPANLAGQLLRLGQS